MTAINKIELGNIYAEYRWDFVKDENGEREIGNDWQYKSITVFKVIRREGDTYFMTILDVCRSDELEVSPVRFNEEIKYDALDVARLVSVNEMFELTDDEANKMSINFL